VTLVGLGGAHGFQRLKNTVRKNLESAQSDRILLWGHLGLGDQISLARSVELWSSRVETLIIPVKRRNLNCVAEMYEYLPNVLVVAMDSDDPRLEGNQISNLAYRFSAAVVDGGRVLYSAFRGAFPEYGINKCLSLSALTLPKELVSQRLVTSLKKRTQLTPPAHPYVFIDHHPGVEGRELPKLILESFEKRGLQVTANSLHASLLDHAALIQSAHELHLVASAPLCLALTAGSSAGAKIAYWSGPEPLLMEDYGPTWREQAIGEGLTTTRPAKLNPRMRAYLSEQMSKFIIEES